MRKLVLSMAVLFASLTGFTQTDPGVGVTVNNSSACDLVIELVAYDGCTIVPTTNVFIAAGGVTVLPPPPPSVHYEFAILYGLLGGTTLVYYLEIQTPSGVAGWMGTPCVPPTIPTSAGFVSCGVPTFISWIGTSATPVIDIN